MHHRLTMLEAVTAHSREVLTLVRSDGTIGVTVGPAAGLLGYRPGDREGTHVAERVHPDDLPLVLDLLQRAHHDPGMAGVIVVRARHLDGSWRHLEVDVVNRLDDPLLEGLVLRVRAHDAATAPTLQSADHETLTSLADALPAGVMWADARSAVVYVNPAAESFFDLPGDALLGQGWQAAVEAEDLPDVLSAAASLATVDRCTVTFRARTSRGLAWLEATFVTVAGSEGASGWFALLHDVTERRRQEADLAHRATHDHLTGLLTRAALADRLTHAMARLRREPGVVTVLFIDLDDFKGVNDRHGHDVGDALLQEVARRLRQVLRPADTLARYGGDEFVAVCEGAGPAEADEVVQRMASALSVPMLLDHDLIKVSASVGVASTSDPETGPAALMTRADRSMYDRKRRSA